MQVGTRARSRLLLGAAICSAVVALLAVVVRLRFSAVLDVDNDLGTPAETWSFGHPGAVTLLIAIEAAFGTVATVVYVLVIAAALWWRGHRRAVAWVVLVMAGASATTTALKLLLRRSRPEWADPVHALNSYSFPSGHASGIASGMGVVAVLATMYVEHRALRRALLLAAAVLALLVGADRIMLGVHNLTDVLAGYAVGGFWVLATLALWPPSEPRSSS